MDEFLNKKKEIIIIIKAQNTKHQTLCKTYPSVSFGNYFMKNDVCVWEGESIFKMFTKYNPSF
jgi:hypothetical protein